MHYGFTCNCEADLGHVIQKNLSYLKISPKSANICLQADKRSWNTCTSSAEIFSSVFLSSTVGKFSEMENQANFCQDIGNHRDVVGLR